MKAMPTKTSIFIILLGVVYPIILAFLFLLYKDLFIVFSLIAASLLIYSAVVNLYILFQLTRGNVYPIGLLLFLSFTVIVIYGFLMFFSIIFVFMLIFMLLFTMTVMPTSVIGVLYLLGWCVAFFMLLTLPLFALFASFMLRDSIRSGPKRY